MDSIRCEPKTDHVHDRKLQCNTQLTDYLGEHQSQLFYNSLLISNIKCDGKHFDSVPVHIGAPLPINMSDDVDGSIGSVKVALGVILHLFQRFPINGDVEFEPQSSGANLRVNSLKDSNSEPQSPRLSLVSIIVYFPVEYMKSANDVINLTDQNKNIHLPPHPHEFVAYPNILTLSIEDVGCRIISGLLHVERLAQNSLPIPRSLFELVTASTPHQFDFSKDPNEAENIDVQTTGSRGLNQHRFVITRQSVYNRAHLIGKLTTDGWQANQLKKPVSIIDRPWYSKLMDSKREKMDAGNSNPHFDCLEWIGLQIRSKTSVVLDNGEDLFEVVKTSHKTDDSMKLGEPEAKKYCDTRIVFVRRESVDCGMALCEQVRKQNYAPVKLRRTRLRGTSYIGIKLKRQPISVSPNDPQYGNHTNSNGARSKKHAICILIDEEKRLGDLSAAYNFSSQNSTQSPISPISQSQLPIATRVKRHSYLCANKQSSVATRAELELVQTKTDAQCDASRKRISAKRSSRNDPDLQTALKRSLMDVANDRMGTRKSRSTPELSTLHDANSSPTGCQPPPQPQKKQEKMANLKQLRGKIKKEKPIKKEIGTVCVRRVVAKDPSTTIRKQLKDRRKKSRKSSFYGTRKRSSRRSLQSRTERVVSQRNSSEASPQTEPLIDADQELNNAHETSNLCKIEIQDVVETKLSQSYPCVNDRCTGCLPLTNSSFTHPNQSISIINDPLYNNSSDGSFHPQMVAHENCFYGSPIHQNVSAHRISHAVYGSHFPIHANQPQAELQVCTAMNEFVQESTNSVNPSVSTMYQQNYESTGLTQPLTMWTKLERPLPAPSMTISQPESSSSLLAPQKIAHNQSFVYNNGSNLPLSIQATNNVFLNGIPVIGSSLTSTNEVNFNSIPMSFVPTISYSLPEHSSWPPSISPWPVGTPMCHDQQSQQHQLGLRPQISPNTTDQQQQLQMGSIPSATVLFPNLPGNSTGLSSAQTFPNQFLTIPDYRLCNRAENLVPHASPEQRTNNMLQAFPINYCFTYPLVEPSQASPALQHQQANSFRSYTPNMVNCDFKSNLPTKVPAQYSIQFIT